MKIILASQSPRRRALLEQMGLEFTCCVSELDEDVFSGLAPEELVKILSREKSEAVAAAYDDDALLIAADTVVVLDGVILGKPADEAQALKMLTALSGRTHSVYTGVTVRQGGRIETICEVTEVTFRSLTAEECALYVATGEPMDKAGAYGIQGYGALLVKGLHGDYFNVMGLPVQRLGQLLGEFDVDCLQKAVQKEAGERM